MVLVGTRAGTGHEKGSVDPYSATTLSCLLELLEISPERNGTSKHSWVPRAHGEEPKASHQSQEGQHRRAGGRCHREAPAEGGGY